MPEIGSLRNFGPEDDVLIQIGATMTRSYCGQNVVIKIDGNVRIGADEHFVYLSIGDRMRILFC